MGEDGTDGTGAGMQMAEARCFAGKTDAVMPSDAGLSKKDSANRFPSPPTLPAMVRLHGVELLLARNNTDCSTVLIHYKCHLGLWAIWLHIVPHPLVALEYSGTLDMV